MSKEGYTTGKQGESDSWNLLKSNGYVRPTAEERTAIKTYYDTIKISIDSSGFDVILESERPTIGKTSTTLFEVKTTGKKRGACISEGFAKLGFTLTKTELDNSDKLGDKYRFLFVNLFSGKIGAYKLEDFFDKDKSRIYQTWSVFIKNDLTAS